jgi:hypothetical protein
MSDRSSESGATPAEPRQAHSPDASSSSVSVPEDRPILLPGLVDPANQLPDDPHQASDIRTPREAGRDLLKRTPAGDHLLPPEGLLNASIPELEQHLAASRWITRSRQFVTVASEELAASMTSARIVAEDILAAHHHRESANQKKLALLADRTREDCLRLDDRIADLEESRLVITNEIAMSHEAADQGLLDRLAEVDRDLAQLRGPRKLSEANLDVIRPMMASSQTQQDLMAAVDQAWDAMNNLVRSSHRRRTRARRGRAQRRALAVAAIAPIIVFVGVAADVAMGRTPAAGIVASITLAYSLWIIDNRYLSPRVARAHRSRLVHELRDEVADWTEMLVEFRRLEGSLRQRAMLVDVSCPPLLGRAIYDFANA